MAKTSSIEKNNRRKKLAKQYSAKRAKLKALTKDQNVSSEERFAAQLKLADLPRNSSPTRIRNRCEVSGRARGYYRKLKMSRIALRQLGNLGQVPGMVKSSW
jgi:small subunit ribosomal protein S14